MRFNATDVPVLQVGVDSRTLSETQLYDIATNLMRVQLATVQGAALPLPYGGKARQIKVDLDPAGAVRERDLAERRQQRDQRAEPRAALGHGEDRRTEYNVRLNSSPDAVALLNDIPIRTVNGTTVYVARRRAGARRVCGADQHRSRERTSRRVQTILRNGGASTLDVVVAHQGRAAQDAARPCRTAYRSISCSTSRCTYARRSRACFAKALIAACLTAAMILLFLGSWRSTDRRRDVDSAVHPRVAHLPLRVRPDDQRHDARRLRARGRHPRRRRDGDDREHPPQHRAWESRCYAAILDGADQIAVPAFVSTLAICIVFMPVFFLGGVTGALFRPLAMAVIFAMLASYFLSRTLVPLMVRYLLPPEMKMYASHHGAGHSPDVFWRVNAWFETHFNQLRDWYVGVLGKALAHRRAVAWGSVGAVIFSAALVPFIGEDFFPRVDGGQFRIHVRAPAGTRLDATEATIADVERAIRADVPASDLGLILANIGVPSSSINLATGDNATIGAADAELLVSLKPDRERPTADYITILRDDFRTRFPGVSFAFQPADIVNRILNLGLPAALDVQVIAGKKADGYAIVRKLASEMRKVPGAVDVRVQQVVNAPELFFAVDRTRASQLGLTQRDVAQSLLISLSSSGQTAPNFWLNPQNGVNYTVAVQTPQYRVASIDQLESTPVIAAGVAPQIFGNLTTMTRRSATAVVDHYNVQKVYDVYAGAEGRDLGGVAHDVDAIIAKTQSSLPPGTTIVMRGQVSSMRDAFTGLGFGLAFAILLVYFLMVVNFQILARSVHHHHGASRRARRHRVDCCSSRTRRSTCRRSWARSWRWASPPRTAFSSSPSRTLGAPTDCRRSKRRSTPERPGCAPSS